MSDWFSTLYSLPFPSFLPSSGGKKKQAKRFAALLHVAEGFVVSKIISVFRSAKQLFGKRDLDLETKVVIVKPVEDEEETVQNIVDKILSPTPNISEDVDTFEDGSWKVSREVAIDTSETTKTPLLLQPPLEKIPKNPFLLIPPFLLALYKSEEKILQNINVHLSSLPWSKVYQIGFGKKNGDEVSIAFETKIGAPIRFLNEKPTAEIANDSLPLIFNSKSWMQYFPIFNSFVWKREKRETDCNIFIDDPGNPLLQNGPVKTYIPISSLEGFHVIHRDPKKADQEDYSKTQNKNEIVRIADIFNYAGTNTMTVKINNMDSTTKSRTEFFPLPFFKETQKTNKIASLLSQTFFSSFSVPKDEKKTQEYYLKVTQIQ